MAPKSYVLDVSVVCIMSTKYFHTDVSGKGVREVLEANVKSGKIMQRWNVDLISVPETGKKLCITDNDKPLLGVESKAEKILNHVW